MWRRLSGSFAALILFTVLAASPVLAQDPQSGAQPDPDIVVLDEVIVTARKVEENLQDVPLSIDTLPRSRT